MLTKEFNVIALMSGTSLDGIDLIYAKYYFDDRWNFKICYSKTYEYSVEWKAILGKLTQKSKQELGKIDIDYTQHLSHVILSFIKEYLIHEIDFIASHGHTALHKPEEDYTYQIGNLQELADILQHKVICDFRTQDVSLGGQGAPLVPIGDLLLFKDYEYCLNLGGFANISYDKKGKRVAFDICPVNIVLNYYVTSLQLDYDDKGQLAAEGIINNELLTDLNNLQYYHESPPKSLGLEWVETNIFPLIAKYDLGIKDVLSTMVEHIAIQISNVLQMETTSVFVTGGGAYNDFLIKRIKSNTKTEIVIPAREIIEYKEALIFGLLGVLKYENKVNCLSSVTGAVKDHSSGKILIPYSVNINS